MPSGRVHEAINLSVLGLAAGVYWLYRETLAIPEPIAVAFVGSYLVGTFLITPDLDLAERQVRSKRRWGWLGWLWVPYGWLFTHRGLSHTWLVGPLTRLLYLGGVGLVLGWLGLVLVRYLGLHPVLEARFSPPPPEVVWALVLGYYVSQWLHLLADGIWPDVRSLRSRRR
ncbi:hydrolase [Meiothermus sp. QL-1]|uniref:metal-binding protein n=1 Tax=Meiothermus sp. QL-1 TaxID=2058095 RepID=UPI000E09E363|nr:metal-binding protein [Meiothermus sp. QL-1]RDI96369.1 hydrolase [Meiothermus sp. QL-1]